MTLESQRSITVVMSGDFEMAERFEAADNDSAPGQIEAKALTTGFNSLTVPSGAAAVTIVPPAGNAVALTLKGITGDTGVILSLTEPTSVALGALAALGITAASSVTVRLIWS